MIRAQARLCATLWLAAVGCSEFQPEPRQQPHVIIIMIDTLRVDRVDAFGGARGTSPFLDTLAERSYVFHAAYAPSSWTSPAIASLFTSRYPSQHDVTHFSSVLAKSEQTLAEQLRKQGYATGGFSSNPLIRGQLGFAQGFTRFATASGRGKSLSKEIERTHRAGLRATTWLRELPESLQEPVFLYLHVMDPHTPYAPSSHALEWAFEDRDVPELKSFNQLVQEHHEFDLAGRETVERLYDAEVRSLDRDLEKVFDELEERNLLSNAVVVVLADHGEEFWDHGSRGHANGLYDEVIRVPLLISVPGQTRRVDVSDPVSVVDLAPTILELAGSFAPLSFEGRSLAPLLSQHGTGLSAWWKQLSAPQQLAPRPVFIELIQYEVLRRRRHERAVVIGDYKIIADVDGSHHFFDRMDDGKELAGDALPDQAREALLRELANFENRMPRGQKAERVPVDDNMKGQLKALGYLY